MFGVIGWGVGSGSGHVLWDSLYFGFGVVSGHVFCGAAMIVVSMARDDICAHGT